MTSHHSPLKNARRKSFQLPGQRHMLPVIFGASLGAFLCFILGFFCLDWVLPGFHIRMMGGEDKSDADRVIALSPEDDTPAPSPVEPPPESAVEKPEDMKPEPIELDLIDILKDDLTMAPGETSIVLPDPEVSEPADSPSPEASPLDLSKLLQGSPSIDTNIPDVALITDNPVKINVQMNDSVDPDKWYEDKLKGNGGKDDSNVPGGNKTLNQLIALPSGSLGKGTGYSRLGADLLFSYDKAELKNSARISMLQLAALIHKNPKTYFIIEGHTDSFGSEDYNNWLSLQRANAVRQWLKGNDIPLDRVYIRACGNSKPVVSTTKNAEGQAANRRVEIHMRKQSEPLPKDALPSSYKVPSQRIPKQASNTAPRPKPLAKPTPSIPKPESKPITPPQEAPKPKTIAVPSLPREEHIPQATPVEEHIPEATPVEDIPPAAIPVDDAPPATHPAQEEPPAPDAIPVPDDFV